MRRFVSTLVATSYQNELTRFLLAKEDCAARSLLKRETQDESGEADILKGDEDSDPDSDNDKDIEERGKKASTVKIANKGISEYAQRREKNIAELKQILEGLKVPKLKRCVITMHHMRVTCVATHLQSIIDNQQHPYHHE